MENNTLEKTDEDQTQGKTVRRRCPLDASLLVYKEQLTEFPDLSGWECPECGYFEF